ncbi:hypothetical protein EYC80_004745 [Monilinia laxa]|uniref:Uncharacterized protein n=1 Tax=Monilinia laxa TaxID=61186 RepID=A0A5N6KHZ0_MONLA|nr:hypothetical protein EYC80_004745 [Monilinia laxa]
MTSLLDWNGHWKRKGEDYNFLLRRRYHELFHEYHLLSILPTTSNIHIYIHKTARANIPCPSLFCSNEAFALNYTIDDHLAYTYISSTCIYVPPCFTFYDHSQFFFQIYTHDEQ